MKQPCSCIICHKEFSYMGIHSHYITAHTKEGNERVKLNGSKGTKNSIKFSNSLKLERIKIYENSPNLCLNCNHSLEYGKKNNKFCSSSCAATYNNIKKDYTTFKPGPKPGFKPKNKSLIKNKQEKPQFTKINWCIVCSTPFIGNRKTCSEQCCKTSLSNSSKNRKNIFNKCVIEYNGIKLGSKYELEVAKSLDENFIKWNQPKPLTYFDNIGKEHKYYPDFYLPDYNIFLDPKNDFLIKNPNPYHGYSDQEKIKWTEVYNNIKILILNKNQLNWNIIKELI